MFIHTGTLIKRESDEWILVSDTETPQTGDLVHTDSTNDIGVLDEFGGKMNGIRKIVAMFSKNEEFAKRIVTIDTNREFLLNRNGIMEHTTLSRLAGRPDLSAILAEVTASDDSLCGIELKKLTKLAELVYDATSKNMHSEEIVRLAYETGIKKGREIKEISFVGGKLEKKKSENALDNILKFSKGELGKSVFKAEYALTEQTKTVKTSFVSETKIPTGKLIAKILMLWE